MKKCIEPPEGGLYAFMAAGSATRSVTLRTGLFGRDIRGEKSYVQLKFDVHLRYRGFHSYPGGQPLPRRYEGSGPQIAGGGGA
jgi:hypothetical protein